MGHSRLHALAITWALFTSPVHSQFMPITAYGDTVGNIALGSGALVSDVDSKNCTKCGSFNVAVGGMSLYENTTGYLNIAIGETAMLHNTTGYSNTATGYAALFSNQTGYNNTASGFDALSYSFSSYNNSAFGAYALFSEFDGLAGHDNTASGVNSLSFDSLGSYNTAAGSAALIYNTDGNYNTAFGAGALSGVSIESDSQGATGSNNTGTGAFALYSYSTGGNNTATGYEALYADTTGNHNTAIGANALYSNTTANFNTADGYATLFSNTTGVQNTASGTQALYSNTSGNYNVASGLDALYGNTTGAANTALGFKAGYNLTTGNNNVDIANQGAAGDASTIKIGTQGTQQTAYIAGIYNVPLSGSTVVVTSTGQLGVSSVSSERFKTAIVPMGADTVKLAQLRPVSFRLKNDSTGTRQFGLIAEEVAKVYPELVIRNEKGRIDGVRYDELAPMLLNEVQKRNAAQDAQIRDLKQQVAELRAAFLSLQAKDERVAQH